MASGTSFTESVLLMTGFEQFYAFSFSLPSINYGPHQAAKIYTVLSFVIFIDIYTLYKVGKKYINSDCTHHNCVSLVRALFVEELGRAEARKRVKKCYL